MHTKQVVKSWSIGVLAAFNIAAFAPAAIAQQPIDYEYFISEDYLSQMTGQNVLVFSEDDFTDPTLMQQLSQTKTRRANAGDQAEKDALSEQSRDILAQGFKDILDALEQKVPQNVYNEWLQSQNLGYLHFMIDSASVRDIQISGACLGALGCSIFISDYMPTAQEWDAVHGVIGQNTLSNPEAFKVMTTWEQLNTGGSHMPSPSGSGTYIPLPTGFYKMLARAQSESLITEQERDAYVLLSMTRSLIRDNVSYDALFYYHYLNKTGSDQDIAIQSEQDYGDIENLHNAIHDLLNLGWQTGDMDAAREQLKEMLVAVAQDNTQKEIVRFYAGSVLKMYDLRGETRPANAPADFSFYTGTLSDAVKDLRADVNAPDPKIPPAP